MGDEGEVRLTLRLPEVLRDTLIEKAKANGRSLNAELVSRLEKTVSDEAQGLSVPDYIDEAEARFERIEHQLEKLREMVLDHREILRSEGHRT